MQRIINEVVGGKVVKENETGEAKKFSQEIVASVKRTRKIAIMAAEKIKNMLTKIIGA